MAAANDYEATVNYLAHDSRTYASVFTQEIRDASRNLATFSERGRIVRELGDPGIREIFVQKYRMIYRIGTECVTILAIIYGGRDLVAAWEERTRD